MNLLFADFGITAVLALIAFLASIASAVIAAQNLPEKPGPGGSKFGLEKNEAPPDNPTPMGGGAPRWAPPLFSRVINHPYVGQTYFNTNTKIKMRLLFDTGIGPMDGGDLNVWIDDTPIFQTVTLDSPRDERRLTDVSVGNNRKEWIFPKSNVQGAGARVYLDGEIYGAPAGDSMEGLLIHEAVEISTSPASQFVPDDSGMQFTKRTIKAPRTYIDLPVAAWNDRDNFRVSVKLGTTTNAFNANANKYTTTTGWIELTKDMYEIEKMSDGRPRIRLTGKIEKGFNQASNLLYFTVNFRQTRATEIKVHYSFAYRSTVEVTVPFLNETHTTFIPVEIFELKTKETRQSRAVFSAPIPAGDVTATYRTLPFGVEIKTFFAKGDNDQPAIPLDLLGQSRAVNQQVAQGILRDYSTTGSVDEAVLGLASGSGGFWREQTGIDAQHVRFRIWFKQSDAPDAEAQGYSKSSDETLDPILANSKALDPASGWVPYFRGGTSDEIVKLSARIQSGIARWSFSLIDMFRGNLKRFGVAESYLNTVERIPHNRYDFRVLRIDEDDMTGVSEVFLEQVTEFVTEQLSFPRRSFLLLEYDEQEGLNSLPEVNVQFKMRKSRQFSGYSHVSQAEQFGRWLAASQSKGITLPDGSVITTSGPFLDSSNFVFDPTLVEPQFVVGWTRNPVWIATEIILDEVGGGGSAGFGLDPASVDWDSAKRAADYCDEIIDGETRSEADWVTTVRLKLYDAVSQVLAGSGVAPAFSRGKWFFPIDDDNIDPDAVIDKLTGKEFTISDDDILDAENDNSVDGLIFDTKDLEGIATDLQISFPDELAGFDQEADPVFIPANSDALIRNVRRFSFPAVRRRSQTERVGNAMIKAEENNQRFVTIRPSNFRTIILDPGDIVLFGSETAKLVSRKAQVIERVTGGSNFRQELKLVLLDGSLRVSDPTLWKGPIGGVIPGLRVPTNTLPGNLVVSSQIVSAPPTSGIVKIEQL